MTTRPPRLFADKSAPACTHVREDTNRIKNAEKWEFVVRYRRERDAGWATDRDQLYIHVCINFSAASCMQNTSIYPCYFTRGSSSCTSSSLSTWTLLMFTSPCTVLQRYDGPCGVSGVAGSCTDEDMTMRELLLIGNGKGCGGAKLFQDN